MREDGRDDVEDEERLPPLDRRAARREVHLLEQRDRVALDAHERASVRTAVFVIDPVERLGLARAAVRRVRDTVSVGVHGHVRAAVGVLEAVEVLRLIRASVAVVGEAVVVEVGLGAAVLVAVAVGVLGYVRAAVRLVRHAVTVLVVLRAAVLVAVVVHVLGDHRAGVVAVLDAVAIVVVVGAAVGVLELVDVLGLGRAAVGLVREVVAVVVRVRAAVRVVVAVRVLGDVHARVVGVDDAIAVRVRAVRRPHRARHHAERRHADALDQAGAARDREHEVAGRHPRADVALEGVLIDLRREGRRAGDLAEHADQRREIVGEREAVGDARPALRREKERLLAPVAADVRREMEAVLRELADRVSAEQRPLVADERVGRREARQRHGAVRAQADRQPVRRAEEVQLRAHPQVTETRRGAALRHDVRREARDLERVAARDAERQHEPYLQSIEERERARQVRRRDVLREHRARADLLTIRRIRRRAGRRVQHERLVRVVKPEADRGRHTPRCLRSLDHQVVSAARRRHEILRGNGIARRGLRRSHERRGAERKGDHERGGECGDYEVSETHGFSGHGRAPSAAP